MEPQKLEKYNDCLSPTEAESTGTNPDRYESYGNLNLYNLR